MRSAEASRRVTAASVATYALLTFAWLWFVAYEQGRAGSFDETLLSVGALVVAALVLPALVGFGVGRWWAFALAAWLIAAALLAEALEPPFEDRGEIESGAGLAALIVLFVHPPLLLAGVALRKFAIRRGVGRKT